MFEEHDIIDRYPQRYPQILFQRQKLGWPYILEAYTRSSYRVRLKNLGLIVTTFLILFDKDALDPNYVFGARLRPNYRKFPS